MLIGLRRWTHRAAIRGTDGLRDDFRVGVLAASIPGFDAVAAKWSAASYRLPRQRHSPLQHAASRPLRQTALRQQQPVVAGRFNQTGPRFSPAEVN